MGTENLVEGEDYYYDDLGKMVLTEDFLARRGNCCQSGCTNCPYGYTEKVDPSYPAELQPNLWDTNEQEN